MNWFRNKDGPDSEEKKPNPSNPRVPRPGMPRRGTPVPIPPSRPGRTVALWALIIVATFVIAQLYFGQKPQRADMGAVKTRARCRSASASTGSQAPSRSTPAPTTKAGRSQASSASPIFASTAGSGRSAVPTVRGGTGSQGCDQSSAGIDTSTGPQGGCIAR